MWVGGWGGLSPHTCLDCLREKGWTLQLVLGFSLPWAIRVMRGIHGRVEGQHVTKCELGGLGLVSVLGREGVQGDHVLGGSFQVPSLGTEPAVARIRGCENV